MSYCIHYEIASIMILLAVMLHFFLKKTITSGQTRLFSLLIVTAFFSSFLDVVTIYLLNQITWIPLVIHILVNQAYLVTFNSTAMIYYCYILLATKEKNLLWYHHLIMWVPIAVDFVLILTTPLTGWVFYYDENRVYCHGNGILILYVNAIVYVTSSLIHTAHDQKKLTMSQRTSVYFFTISSLLSVVFQTFYQTMLMTGFAVAISVLLIYLSLENPIDFTDKQLGTYNREAFVRILGSEIDVKHSFYVFGIQIEGFRYLSERLGIHNSDMVLKEVAQFLTESAVDGKVFYVTGMRFAVIMRAEESCKNAFIERVRQRFMEPFDVSGMEVTLTAPMYCVEYPLEVKSVEDIMDTIEYFMDEIETGESGIVIYDSNRIIVKKRREQLLVQIMQRALRYQEFMVYYQPIYSVEQRKFTSAEALIRLKDECLGMISPEEFIPLAEKKGLILEIGEYVFKSVCQFIVQERIWEKGIEYIEVNLSVVQCMQDRMYEKLLELMDSYGVDARMIKLEITETAAAVSSESLLNNMRPMIRRGVGFAMDDYGTGYSNTVNLINFPFEIIKLDKSMVWEAMENEKMALALKHLTAMIKEMQMEIVAEGIENQEQATILESYGCDYFQGYFYSKPITSQEFVKLLRGEP